MKQKVFLNIEDVYEEMIDLRRDFHMYPELSFKEFKTAEKIANFQRDIGLDVRTNVGGNGVVATLQGGKPGKTIAIRADFDALPITEENDVFYASKNPGVMHACGHDAHTAIALGISKALVQVQDKLPGKVVFIHQHAEEFYPGGAKGMIEDGALDGVDVIFATHMENGIPVDHMIQNDAYVFASADDFTIEVEGNGGHGGEPQGATDVLAIGSQLVSSLQQVISRKIDPFKPTVLSIGSFHGGTATNIIPSKATLKGTVRTFDAGARQDVHDWLQQITKKTCEAFGATSTVTYQFGYPATKNDENMNQILVHAAKDVLDEDCIHETQPLMSAEDFSYFLEKIPGAYFLIGSANENKGFTYPYHHPKFDIDEKALLNGAKILASTLFDYWDAYN